MFVCINFTFCTSLILYRPVKYRQQISKPVNVPNFWCSNSHFFLGALSLHQIHYNPNKGKILAYISLIPFCLLIVGFILAFLGGECGPLARCKGTDAIIKTHLVNIKASSVKYYDLHKSYGTTSGDCAIKNTLFTDKEFKIRDTVQKIQSLESSITCDSTQNIWAISTALRDPTRGSFCVDSSGLATTGKVSFIAHMCTK